MMLAAAPIVSLFLTMPAGFGDFCLRSTSMPLFVCDTAKPCGRKRVIYGEVRVHREKRGVTPASGGKAFV
uniref:Secreted protein n=1 Tax=Setaria viridis TaxID=4556 RepID=A0A4U6T4H3_SETVI|nr:hypothetical protein SEVIR_9G372132v2 [Setaria viridis]